MKLFRDKFLGYKRCPYILPKCCVITSSTPGIEFVCFDASQGPEPQDSVPESSQWLDSWIPARYPLPINTRVGTPGLGITLSFASDVVLHLNFLKQFLKEWNG